MRGDGRTPRGLRAHQTTSHSDGGTTRSVAPTPTGRCAITKGRNNKQAKITSADVTTGRRIPQATSAAPIKKPSSIGRDQQSVQHRTQPKTIHQQPPTDIKKIEPIPNIDSRQNKNGPPEALRFVPSSKDDTNNNKGASVNMNIGGRVLWIWPSLPPQHCISKGANSRSIRRWNIFVFSNQTTIKRQDKREKIASSSQKAVLDYINNLTYW